MLRAFHPEQPLVTRKERRNANATHQAEFRTALQAVVEQIAEETRGYLWLTQGQHGIDWLYSRCKNMSKMARYLERCRLWHFDTAAYTIALQHGGRSASPGELAMLNTLPPVFTELVNKMQERGTWAYQEGITSLLIEDLYHL